MNETPSYTVCLNFSEGESKAKSETTVQCLHCGAMLLLVNQDPLDGVTCSSCGSALQFIFEFGRYKISKYINSGGTSRVYLAEDEHGSKVALKILKANGEDTSEVIELFLHSSELARKLDHPNVSRIYEYGRFQGFYFIAMEYIDGITVADLLEKMQEHTKKSVRQHPDIQWDMNKKQFSSSLPELIALEIILQTAQGLEAAHLLGIVHGDIKPENIIISYEGCAKILDFGLAQRMDAVVAKGEGGSKIFGTPLYIPPEKINGENADFRSDIYSLGETLHHLLRGIPRSKGKTMTDTLKKHLHLPSVSFQAYAPWVSKPTCRVLTKCSGKSPSDRYQTHIELIADLTLAKNQVLNSISESLSDGELILKNFIDEFRPKPPKKQFSDLTKTTTDIVMRFFNRK
jgi:serine/threonine protein kinase